MIECKYNTFGVFNDRLKIGPARWEHFDLIFVHDGHIVIWPDDGKRLELKTGQSVLLYPQTEFCGYTMADCTRVSVHHFSILKNKALPEDIGKLIGRKNGYESFLNIPDRQVERDIERIVNIRQSGELTYLDDEMMSSVMLLVLLGVHHANGNLHHNRSEMFDKLMSFMEENLDRNISLDEMAAICQLSTSHFRAIFKKHFKQSPGVFFRNLRMNAVAKQLRETMIPIKEISHQGGFDVLSNFYRAFRAAYDMSPAEYRRKNIPKG